MVNFFKNVFYLLDVSLFGFEGSGGLLSTCCCYLCIVFAVFVSLLIPKFVGVLDW